MSISTYGNYFAAGVESTSGETLLFYHARRIPLIPLPSPDRGDDDDDDMGFVVAVVVITILASAAGVIVVIVVLTKKGIINITKFKRG